MGPRDEEMRKAGKYFQLAIDADPNFAPAFIGLSRAHYNLWWSSDEDFVVMRKAAQRALELDPTSSDAHEALAAVKSDLDWDWPGAEAECRRAIALNPNSASAHVSLGNILDLRGEMDEGWKEAQIAQQLDPNQDHLSNALYLRGQYDRAIELLKRTSEASPDNANTRYFLSQAYARNGMYAESVQELGKSLTLFGLPELAARIQSAFASNGWRAAQFQWAKELEQSIATRQSYFPGILAQTYAQVGDKDRAFYWLEQGYAHRQLAITDPILEFVKVEPGFAPLRSDPRFNAFLRRIGL
jgi:tetratricopeptide (TPR) repeat protein